jgi:sulfite dehydrogenase (cytochrome) subunit B
MRLAIALALAVAKTPALADEFAIKLKDAPGVDVVSRNCAACHSLDYPIANSAFLDAKGWDAEVTKMIKVFHAPIDDADAATIKDYLTKNYGK